MLNIFNKTCRTCTETPATTIPLTTNIENIMSSITYASILEDIAKLEFTSPLASQLPQQLCDSCCSKLLRAYEFVEQARHSEVKLLQVLSTQQDLGEELNLKSIQEHLQVKDETINDCETLGDSTVTSHTEDNEHLADSDDNADTALEPALLSPHAYEVIDKSVEFQALQQESSFKDLPINSSRFSFEEVFFEDNRLDTFSINVKDSAMETSSHKGSFECKQCDRQYRDENALSCHIKYKHKIDTEPSEQSSLHCKRVAQCPDCDYIAKSYASLDYHIRANHVSEKDKWKCKFCAYRNNKKIELMSHMKKQHLMEIKLLKFNKAKGAKSDEDESQYQEINTVENVEVLEKAYNCSDYSSGDEQIIRDLLNIRRRSSPRKSLKYINKNECCKADNERLTENQNCALEKVETEMINQEICAEFIKNTISEQSSQHGQDEKNDNGYFVMARSALMKCRFCDYTAKTASALHYHRRSKHGTEEDKCKCNFCEYTNYKKFSILNHIKKTHLPIIKDLKAQRKKGLTNEELIQLLSNYDDNQRRPEQQVSTVDGHNSSSDDEDFIRDIINMKKRGGRRSQAKKFAIRCDECGNVYKDSRSLSIHKRNVHIQHSYNPCPHCNRKYKRKYDLKLHIRHAHTSKNRTDAQVEKEEEEEETKRTPIVREKRFMCTQCSYTCTTSTLLTIHTNRHHTGERPFKCDVCSKSFVVAFDLKTHSYLHTGERPYSCPVCSKGFRDRSHMLKHKRIHSEEKPFNCLECGKGFSKKYNLSIHMRTHMKGVKLNCSVCGKFFENRAQLSIHQINESHHGEAD